MTNPPPTDWTATSPPVDDAAIAVNLTGITKRFGDVTAVNDIDLQIADGEFFAMLGPSGCGKTTTLRMIAGLEFPTEGSLQIFGVEVGTQPPNKRPVNTVFQNYALFPHLTVRDNVSFGLRMQGTNKREAARRADELIELVQLSGMEKRKPAQLSGGQQQRVALARALVNEPQVLLLDEPLGALDLKLRQEMQTELKSLQRDLGVSFVFVTHDQEEALTMSDRIAVMHEGNLLQVGRAEDLYERPESRFVADFIGQTNLIDATVADADMIVLTNGTKVKAPNPHPAGTSVAMSLRPESIEIGRPGTVPTEYEPTSLPGVVKSVTYLGHALVYDVGVDWIDLEVRTENVPAEQRFTVGDDVAIWWDRHADWVVPNE
ncbi:MAG: ABC transporter ATP-binding protein [Acidimicrobiales bacterium]|nr:ABC transporter ATP-binding protein [Acidimicrobiales bacterium]